MMLAQSLTAIIVFWAIIGGLGASLLLPAMQKLIHGNIEHDAEVMSNTALTQQLQGQPPAV